MRRILTDESETAALARRLAARARPGDALLLAGPLGAGKTSFARAFIRALTGDPALTVPSPTFTLVQTYETASGPVWHYDLWRLSGPDALEELGWDEAREGIILAEWPDRLGPLAPPHALNVTFFHHPTGREVILNGDERWLHGS